MPIPDSFVAVSLKSYGESLSVAMGPHNFTTSQRDQISVYWMAKSNPDFERKIYKQIRKKIKLSPDTQALKKDD